MDKRITVVLADANEEFRTALKQALEATGEFDVVGCAADGLAAAQDIAERKPQLLVMDLLLPGLDGFGVLEQAAKDKVQMKTVVVSALYRDQIVSQAMSRGVSFFMPKPCELTSLLDQMRRAVNEGEESEDESQALEREVTAVIHEVGVPAHIKGYQYVREAIVIAVQDMDVINAVTKVLYPEVARRYSTTPSRVEAPTCKLLDSLGVTQFEAVAGRIPGFRETKAESIAAALDALGATSADAVMVGDRMYDVRGAAELGIPCIGIYSGAAVPGELEEVGAVAACKDILEVGRVLGVW